MISCDVSVTNYVCYWYTLTNVDALPTVRQIKNNISSTNEKLHHLNVNYLILSIRCAWWFDEKATENKMKQKQKLLAGWKQYSNIKMWHYN